MSVYLRPINHTDKRLMAPSEASVIRSSPIASLDSVRNEGYNVVSASIFDRINRSNVENASDREYEDRYTRVGYIELTKKVLNPFLAGRKAPVWRAILGLKENDMMNIINANVLFDLETEEEVKLASIGTSVFDIERYLFGADYLCYLLDKVDVKHKIESALFGTFVAPCLSSKELKMIDDGLSWGEIVKIPDNKLHEIVEGKMDGWLYSNYAIDLSSSDFTEARQREIYDQIADKTLSVDITHLDQFPLISLLISMDKPDGKDKLKSQIMDYLFVLPYGYRPTIDKRVDPLTSQYNKLVNVNLELRDILDQPRPTCFTVLNKYREVVSYIRNIFIGDENIIKSQRLKDYKSISDMITGKEGLMRNRMQGARIDYSGRGVITCDPDMPIDTIGVPKKLLYKIAEPGIIKGLRDYQVDGTGTKPFKNKNLTSYSSLDPSRQEVITFEEYAEKWFKEKDRYGVPGRQPTLFYLGIQAFKVIPVEGDSIILSPLIVMPFNADFDGDQMHFNMPVTPKAVKEVKDRMAFHNNLRYPKNGEPTVVVRHEINYGLWIASIMREDERAKNWSSSDIASVGETFELKNNTGAFNTIYEAVCRQVMNVYDIVELPGGRKTTAGIAAIEYALYGPHTHGNLEESLDEHYAQKIEAAKAKGKELPYNKRGLTSKIVTKLMKKFYGDNSKQFLNAINRTVRLGFKVAKIWPPNLSTVVDPSIRAYIKSKLETFNEDILQREYLLDIGIEIESEFTTYFNNKWDALKKDVVSYLEENLGLDNGYVAMWKSDSKGSDSNVQQIFGLKGRIQKNDTTAFNSIITSCYSEQMTSLEHFISSYGANKGIADKVLATAKPGYMSRKLEHTGAIGVITHPDCGTDEGMQFTVEDIVPFIEVSQTSRYGVNPPPNCSVEEEMDFYNRPETQTQFLAAKEYLSKILVGRWCITENGGSQFISDTDAASNFIERFWGHINPDTHKFEKTGNGVVKMRSPIYCKKPLCKKCYGRDITTGKDSPDIGKPVGFIAAQSIGEPGTQLTMKNFQRGGVVSEANLTSSFALIEDYFELHDFSTSKKNKHGVIFYDAISPVEGYVKTQHLGNGSKRILVTRTPNVEDRKNLIPGTLKIIVPESTHLKNYVRRGDSFQRIQGNLNMKEVLKHRGIDKAVSYITLMLHSIFATQDVAFQHFDTIVSSMTSAYLLADAKPSYDDKPIPYGEDSSFRVGSVLSRQEYYYGTDGTAPALWTLIGTKTLPKFRSDFFESLLMENMDSYVPRAILMNQSDSMSNPITRAAFGLNIGIGSDLENKE